MSVVKRLDILDLPEDARDLVRECEAQGQRTFFERNGRPVAMLVSYDEYLALRETIEIANDSLLFAKLAEADEEDAGRGGPPAAAAAHHARRTGRSRRARRHRAASRAVARMVRINDNPIAGAPLFEPLKGLWSYRTGELRIIYKIVAEARSW